MLAFALTFVVAAAPPPPRGFPAAHSMELVTQVDTRLANWLNNKVDRAILLATREELEAFFASPKVKGADLKTLVASAQQEQAEFAELKTFTPTTVLIEYVDRAATLHLFDTSGNRCEVPLFRVGTEAAPRYVLLSGPRTDTRSLESVVERGKLAKAMLVFAEKKDGAWLTGSLPTPKAADCDATIRNALKTVFVAEKSYFAEFDSYSNSLSKIGVDPKSLRINSVKVTVSGAAPDQTFVVQIGLGSALMTMNDKAQVTVVGACP